MLEHLPLVALVVGVTVTVEENMYNYLAIHIYFLISVYIHTYSKRIAFYVYNRKKPQKKPQKNCKQEYVSLENDIQHKS